VAAFSATILIVISIAIIGSAPFSYQQASERTGPRITSTNIVDGEVSNQDLAPDAVTSDKIKDGEVKAEDLDPSIEIGGEGSAPSFNLQVTERSNTISAFEGVEGIEGGAPGPVSVQCEPDEIVTGGGFAYEGSIPRHSPTITQKQDNGWTVTFPDANRGDLITAYAECLKVVPIAAENE
jgi:hypothetical protein